MLFGGLAAPEADKLEKVHEALGWLDGYLDGQDYAAGDTVTIADHSLVASVATFAATGQFLEPTIVNLQSRDVYLYPLTVGFLSPSVYIDFRIAISKF